MNDQNGKCKAGYYYCYTDEKCKPIPKGFKVVGAAGMLRKENGHSVDDENNGKKSLMGMAMEMVLVIPMVTVMAVMVEG